MMFKNYTRKNLLSKSLRKIVDRKIGLIKYLTVESENSISHGTIATYGSVVQVTQSVPQPSILIVCEHASNHVPPHLDSLGLPQEVLETHVAWDPGARGVAEAMQSRLPAVLVQSQVSRLVYDCNRPPEAPSAIPAKSEIYGIPANANLTTAARQERVEHVYKPFEQAIRTEIKKRRAKLYLMITIHSFTPIYHGRPRDVELGILHGNDTRFAHAMMAHIPSPQVYDIRLNEPYSAQDGVAHTLNLHASANGLMNVMIEIRNDLIQTPDAQVAMAIYLTQWTERTLHSLSQVAS